jgi:excisionase family DNA binding protein
MFTVKTAAKELGISSSLVYGLCAAGKIRHERHGLGRGTIRIPREALDEYRKHSTVSGADGVAAPALKLKHLKLSPS